jgi:hypothetical protein
MDYIRVNFLDSEKKSHRTWILPKEDFINIADNFCMYFNDSDLLDECSGLVEHGDDDFEHVVSCAVAFLGDYYDCEVTFSYCDMSDQNHD